jgi:iron(III) transport system substrate-binding protein
MKLRIPRRSLLLAAAALPFVRPARAAPPAPGVVTPELLAAAKTEGKIGWYTADDLVLATHVAKAFQEKYGVTVQLERSGAERIYQRISQEFGSNVHAADVVTSSDVSYLAAWKKSGWIIPYIPEEAAKWRAEAFEADGYYVVDKFTLFICGYNSRLVKAEDAPKTWMDLLDPKWKGKMVKAHPGYSGAITNGTFALSRLFGWEYFERLAKQAIMQVQSATDPPARIAQGERAVMADAAENTALRLIGNGAPIVCVYPTEGVPVVPVGSSILAKAPHPNAAKLFMHYLCSAECQGFNIGHGARTFSPEVTEPASWTKLSSMKLLINDVEALSREAAEVKKRYSQIFGV